MYTYVCAYELSTCDTIEMRLNEKCLYCASVSNIRMFVHTVHTYVRRCVCVHVCV